MAYLVAADIENFLNITLEPAGAALVDDLIEGVSEYADSMCGRTWTKQSTDSITEKFDGGGSRFVVKISPIKEIVTVKVDGETLAADEFYVYDFMVRTDRVTSPGFRNVEMVYKTNANNLPADLKMALLQWVGQLFKSSTDGGKVASHVSSGPVSIDYATKEGVPEIVNTMIAKYRIIAIG